MIKEYKENRKTVDGLYDLLDEKREKNVEATKKVYAKYRNLKYELDDKERKETEILNEGFGVEETKIQESIAEHSIIIEQVKRILAFKKITHKNYGLSFEVKTYGDKTLELIDTIKTPCLELRVYIYENAKPKNKYALVAMGVSIFSYNEKLGKFPRSYGLHLNDRGVKIAMPFKDAPMIENLKEYYHKNKAKLLGDFLVQHTELEREYEIVCQEYNTPEWERLYWENEKEYYEKCYTGGTGMEEYKTALRELEKINR